MKRPILLVLWVFVLSCANAQINLVGAGNNQGNNIEIVKWQALDSASVVTFPTQREAYYLSSSVFDAWNGLYYLSGINSTGSGLFSFNTLTNEQQFVDFTSFSNISEIDMSTGKVYNLFADSLGFISINEYYIATGTDSLIGQVYEQGIPGLVVDAISFDANNGILYYVGVDSTSSLCLFSFHVRENDFFYEKVQLSFTAAINNITSLNYDNEKDLLFAMNAEFDELGNYQGNSVVELDIKSGEVITRGQLTGFPYYLAASSAYDQNTGSMLVVAFDSAFVRKMIVFNTNNNTFTTGFVPGSVSELVCDNSEFARSTYLLTAVPKKEQTTLVLYPNPANELVSIEGQGIDSLPALLLIYQVDGKLVKEINFNSHHLKVLDVSDMNAGIYLLHLKTQKELLQSKLVVF